METKRASSHDERAWEFERGQRVVLEHIANGAPLPALLRDITLLIERQQDGMLCSILLLDDEQACVRHGAAPSLPADFVRFIDGSKIGPQAGSCGTAAYLGERVIVEDIATHPTWVDYRDLALGFGLRACWSSPIFSTTRDVLGTFAMYFREPRTPNAEAFEWVERATHLAAVAIERDRSAEALRTNAQLRQIVFDGISDSLFSVAVEDRDEFRFACVNAAFLRSTGLSEEQLVGRPLTEIIPEASRAVVLESYRICAREKRTVTWDEVAAYPAGTKYGAVSISPVFDANGVCVTILGTVHDITERKQAEERIRSQAALLDGANDAILVRDLDGSIRYWNNGAARLYGWSREEALGRKTIDLIYRAPEAFEEAQRHVLAAGAWRGELDQVTRAGRALVIEGSWTLLRDERGHPSAVLAINTDVTEKKKLEQRLLRAQRMEGLGRLAGSIAHDFNNILSAILANVELGKMELEPAHAAHGVLTEIAQAGSRATSLVRQILTFSLEQTPKRERVSLTAVTEEALRLLRLTKPRAVEIEAHFAPDVPDILGDSTNVHQVVMNLCSNALHATGAGGGRVALRLERAVLDEDLVEAAFDGTSELGAGTYARLIVEDAGVGMDEATLERIFDPFFTTKAPGKGTGLGLAVVHGIVRSHRGGIFVRSAPGRGSAFSVYFPAA